ncbi:MAG: hypothetical protein ABIR84_09465, partial [Candidatus Nitrotoga sp.]
DRHMGQGNVLDRRCPTLVVEQIDQPGNRRGQRTYQAADHAVERHGVPYGGRRDGQTDQIADQRKDPQAEREHTSMRWIGCLPILAGVRIYIPFNGFG